MALEAPPDDPTPRWLHVLAHVRRWIVVTFLVIGAVVTAQRQVVALLDPAASWELDPAWALYLAGAVGFAVRAFWARYLAICFMVALLTLDVFWRSVDASSVTLLAFILLISGPSMRRLFEDRPDGGGRWGRGGDRRIGLLRVLFVAQAVALALLWGAGARHLPLVRPLALAAGLPLAGLAFQRTWAALLAVPLLAAEAWLALWAFGVDKVHWGTPPAWAFPVTLLATVAASAVVLGPFVRGFVRALGRGEPGR
jgi:hypothetical protein